LTPNWNGKTEVNTNPTWCSGWLSWDNFNPDNTNWTRLVASSGNYGSSCSLGPYLSGQYLVFSCPSDGFTCVQHDGNDPRVRSISMNAYITGGAPSPGQENGSLAFWQNYNKMADLVNPNPSALFVTLDEHPDSINDAWFVTDETLSGLWPDLPASYHNGAGGFSFADGHSEIHKWMSAATVQPVRKIYINGTISDTPGNIDASWLALHASARTK
jgi:prepilin-type processing-associated H-X9-DG protein